MIATLLLYKIEVTDRHPLLMAACAAAVAVGGAMLSGWLA